MINALRGHLAEYGSVAPKKTVNLRRLADALHDPHSGLPSVVVELGLVFLDQISGLTEQIVELEKQLRVAAASDDAARRLQTMPRIGPITAMAVAAFAPPMESVVGAPCTPRQRRLQSNARWPVNDLPAGTGGIR